MFLRKTRIKLFVCLVGVTVISTDKLWAVVSVSPVRLMWHIHGVCLRSCWTSDGSLVRKSVWKVEANSGTFEDHLRFLCFVILTGWFWEMRSVARPISPSPPPTPSVFLSLFSRARHGAQLLLLYWKPHWPQLHVDDVVQSVFTPRGDCWHYLTLCSSNRMLLLDIYLCWTDF